jgi:hypothetical protein
VVVAAAAAAAEAEAAAAAAAEAAGVASPARRLCRSTSTSCRLLLLDVLSMGATYIRCAPRRNPDGDLGMILGMNLGTISG